MVRNGDTARRMHSYPGNGKHGYSLPGARSGMFFCFAAIVVFLLPLLLPPPAFSKNHDSHPNQVQKQGTQERGTAERLHDSARKLVEALDKDEDADIHTENVLKDLDAAETEEAEHQQRFEEIEKRLQGIASGTILSRHQEVVKEYKKKTTEFKKRAAAVKEAKKKKASKETIRQRTRSLIEFLETNKPKKKYELKSTANRLPWRVIAPGEMQLLGDASGIPSQPAVVTSATPPSADDLSATADVQISPEIQNLAKSLDNHPLTIFRYVSNNYRYAPYYGSMKGSLDTYWEKEGNDYDLASLLIALLRASNIPARYVKAKTVVSVDKVKKWTGMNTAMAAIQYLSSAQIPYGYYTQGGAISHVEMEHVYVEAYVPYSNYRGTGEDASGKLWIPLDPSFKEERILQEGTDIAAGMGMDWKTFSDDYFSAVRNMTPREYYLERVNQYIAQNYPGNSLDTLKRVSEIKTMRFDFLPNALPYIVTQVQGRFSALPQELRHRLRFNIPAVLDYSVGLSEAAGRRITLTFAGATPQDQAVIETFGTIFDTPPYLIKVKPVLRIDGVPAAEGSVMNAGISASFNVEYTQPGGSAEVFDHHIRVGSYNAVGITIGNVRPEFLDISKVEESGEPFLPKMLHSLAMKYHARLNQARQTLNDTMKIRSRTFITEALVSTRQDTKYNSWGIPVSFGLVGYTIDAKEMATAVVSVEGYDKAKAINFAMIQGHEASYQENATFEDNLFWVTGLSAVKGLPLLKAMGIEIRELEPYQTFANPNLPAIAVEDINNALNMGWKVIVPMETGGLPAVPYIKYDPATGGAGYMIASAAGGFTGYVEASTDLLDMMRFSFAWWGTKQLLSMDFEALEPENDKTYVLGSVFFLHLKMILRWSDGTVEETAHDRDGIPWGLWVRTGPWVFVSSGLPLPWWNPGRYNIMHNGNSIFNFNVWGVKIDSEASGKYLGIKTENDVDTIPTPMTVTYDIVGLRNANPVSVSMKIYDSANAEIRTKSLPLTVGEGQTTTWDGKNTGGQVVVPGEYSIVIEAEEDSGKAKSTSHTVTVFKVEITTPTTTARNITAAPAMPTVPFQAEVKPASINIADITFKWYLDMTFTQHGRNDRHRVPDAGTTDITGNGDWTPEWGDLFAGGEVKVYVTAVVDSVEAKGDKKGYEIRGTNPANGDVNATLGGFPATNIACWESMHTLDQFTAAEWPLFGAPNGWGIMQLDNPPAQCPLTERVIWNWRDNTAMGLCAIDGKRREAQASINNVSRTYPAAPPFPATVAINGQTYSAFSIDVIKRYNGGRYFGYNAVLNQWTVVNTGPNPNYVDNVLGAVCN